MRITANMVTIARIVLMPLPGYLLYGGNNAMLVGLSALAVLGFTDWLDGQMARREGPTALGSFLDPIADKIFIAVIYLPLTERGLIPLWMTACIFARDFLVTSLRTSLLLREAPMRTSTLAKIKTGIQMFGIGYVILYSVAPDAWFAWVLIGAPLAVPLAVILYRLIKGKKQGPRSFTMLGLTTVAFAARWVLGADWAITLTLYAITGMTILSGFSYLVDAWSALKSKAASPREIPRFALDGLLVPLSFVFLLGRFQTTGMSTMIILALTLELAVGGLGNLLASHKIVPRFRWIAVKSLTQVVFATCALALWWTGGSVVSLPGEVFIIAALLVTMIYAISAFGRHRAVYLAEI